MVAGHVPEGEGLWLDEQVYFSYGSFEPVKAELARRIPITGTLAIGAAVIWLALGIPIGILSGIRRAIGRRPRGDDLRDHRGVDADLLARPAAAVRLLVQVGALTVERDPHRLQRVGWGVPGGPRGALHPAMGVPRLHQRGVLRTDGPRQPDRDDERGLHQDGPRQGLVRASGDLQARPARRAHARRHDARPGRRPPPRRRLHHRDRLRIARDRAARGPVDRHQRLPDGDGSDDPRARSSSPSRTWSWTSRTPSWTRG